MIFNRTELYRCSLTHLLLPAEYFNFGVEHSISYPGLLWVNVSQRSVNGRYAKVRKAHYPTNAHHRKGVCMYGPWVDDPTGFACWILTNMGFPRFIDGEKVSLDRIDNDGDYEPGNLRWATSLEQAHNRNRGELSPWHETETARTF